MKEIYLVKEGCGTHIVYDAGELERHKKMGWTERPADWLEKKNAEYKARRSKEVKAELARLQAEQEALGSEDEPEADPAPKKRVKQAA